MEQAVETCEEARGILAGVGARDFTDLTAASVYADTADSQARHSPSSAASRTPSARARGVRDPEAVLSRRPGDIRFDEEPRARRRPARADRRCGGRILRPHRNLRRAPSRRARTSCASTRATWGAGSIWSRRRTGWQAYSASRAGCATRWPSSGPSDARGRRRLPPSAAAVFEEPGTGSRSRRWNSTCARMRSAPSSLRPRPPRPVPRSSAKAPLGGALAIGRRRRSAPGSPLLAGDARLRSATCSPTSPSSTGSSPVRRPDRPEHPRRPLSWMLGALSDAAIQLSRFPEAEPRLAGASVCPRRLGDLARERADRHPEAGLRAGEAGPPRGGAEAARAGARYTASDGRSQRGTQSTSSMRSRYVSAIAQETVPPAVRAAQALATATAELDLLLG